MKLIANLSAILMLIFLSGCTPPETHKSQAEAPVVPQKVAPEEGEIWQTQGEEPPLTSSKAGKTLRLVRLMDGGACKNDLEGVGGIFLLYAEPDDIERIKNEQGTQIFAEFEKTISKIASDALQQAVENTDFSLDPFALDVTDAQLKVAKRLLKQFDLALAPVIEEFQQDTTLAIDIVPFFRSLVFYTEGCDATHEHPNGSEDDSE